MKKPYNKWAIIPFHCPYCHRTVWLEPYRKADVWHDFADRFFEDKICSDCINGFVRK